MSTLKQISAAAIGELKPDLVLLLDLDPKLGLARAKRRTTEIHKRDDSESEDSWNRFEAQELAFHQRVREGFLTLAKDEPDRFAIVDASKKLDQVERSIKSVVVSRW